ncbi:alpha-L-rhamnosidase [Actinophytocola xinjiangensis]|uniref:alpha-L-rhamnosidase n=1 Tax=Actinophytocola xinjiangensis TaxID=485602 RepID=A0A7Z1AWY5_9PSEU|nr:alpha-L-rhamnosidase [Actinophytocola xinjiangensis]
MATPTRPRVEHWTSGERVLGIGVASPRLSWTVPDAGTGFRQVAYEVEVAGPGGRQVHLVRSADQVLVPWPTTPLVSRERVTVRVRVRDTEWSPWSDPVEVETGLLTPADWSAAFVSPVPTGEADTSSPELTCRITAPEDLAAARLYLTAHGVYVPFLNGVRIGQDLFAPGWTSYDHRLRYQTYDVTELLCPGDNTLSVLLGNGWYRGRLGWRGQRALYGDRLALLAQLELTTTTGERHVHGTDDTWVATPSGILADDLYDGQRTDLRPPSARPAAVERIDADLTRLVAPDGPPVRATETLAPVTVTTSPAGRTVVDFGQNLVGWVRLRVRGAAGDEVTVRHAEVLENGELATRPLRSAKATDSYLLAGDTDETLEPLFTFHGFRYAEITGTGPIAAEDVTAVVIGTDLLRTGWFSSSSPTLDRFHENVVWSMRGNFLDVPTDCPQRDERMGWTGDIQVFGPTATFLYDCAGMLTSWLADLAADQLEDGSVPFVVPDVLRDRSASAAAWGDAAVALPWTLYQRTGDLDLLARQLPSMCAWVDHLAALAGENHLWTGGFQYGDWLDPDAPPQQPGLAKAHPDVVATAHLAHSAEILALASAVLGEADAATRYGGIAAAVREAFAAEYVTAHGRVLSDSPTAYAMALCWNLLPSAAQRAHAGTRLADLVRASGFRISTGFVGTPLICDALVSAGQSELAYRLLTQTGCPSWLYPVTMGATTIWERWDSMLPDGSINPGSMTSFNHYALGAVADWLHRGVAGLAPAAPGYRAILIRPTPTRQLDFASATHHTPYGQAHASWRRTGDQLTVLATVPVGATATVHLPGEPARRIVGPGRYEWRLPDPTPVPRPPGPTSTIRDVFDHVDTWTSVVAAACATEVVSGEVELARRLAPYLDAPASELVSCLTRDRPAPGSDELRTALHPVVPQRD